MDTAATSSTTATNATNTSSIACTIPSTSLASSSIAAAAAAAAVAIAVEVEQVLGLEFVRRQAIQQNREARAQAKTDNNPLVVDYFRRRGRGGRRWCPQGLQGIFRELSGIDDGVAV